MRLRPHVCLVTLIATAALNEKAHAWYGPVCYPDTTRTITLTLPSITGEVPGDIRVDFDDNDHRVSLGSVKASVSVPNAHEVTLIRNAQAETGTFAVVLTSPRSNVSYKFEMEFRKSAAECQGAVIRVSGRDAPAPAPASPAKSRPQSVPRQHPLIKAPAASAPIISAPIISAPSISAPSISAPAASPPSSASLAPEAKVSADAPSISPIEAPTEPAAASAPTTPVPPSQEPAAPVAAVVPTSAAAPLATAPAADAPPQPAPGSEADAER